MSSLGPLGGSPRVVSKSQAIADRLTTAIAVGAFSPGDRLPSERSLAETLGVSRVTVREALRIVSELGLVTSARGREGGTFVAATTRTGKARAATRRTLEQELPALREFSDYRCLVEGTIARTAAERCTDIDATRLLARLSEFDAAPDLSAARAADLRLHHEVAAIARNERLAALSVELVAEATLGFGSEPYPAEFLDRARQEHHALVRAVVARDSNGAFDLARSHHTLTLEILEAGLADVASDEGEELEGR